MAYPYNNNYLNQYQLPALSTTPYINWGNGAQRSMALGQTRAMIGSFGSSNPVNVNQSNQMLSGMIGGQANGKSNMASNLGGIAQMAGGAVLDAIGKPRGKYERGLYDAADPLYHLAGNNKSVVGDTLSDVGVSMFKSSAQSGNLMGMAAGGIVKGIGSGINALFGTGVDQEKLDKANSGTNYLTSFNPNASSFGDIQNIASVGNIESPYSGGLFRKGWARRRNRKLRDKRNFAQEHAESSLENNIDNIAGEQTNMGLRSYFSYGGPLVVTSPMMQYNDTGMGATEYNAMADYLLMKNKQAENKNTMSGMGLAGNMGANVNVFADGGEIHINPKNKGKFNATKKRTGKTTEELTHSKNPLTRKRAIFAQNAKKWHHAYGGPLFAFGGDLQTNSSDFPTGLTHIDVGGSHEENPYEGIQMGIDKEGTPNLVEEKEVVWNDYVFSARIPVDEETKKKFHIGKKKEITYADLAKRLEKEISERPNDPLSKAGFKAQMEALQESQERQKQEMEAERARQAFEALSPEEQVAVMDNAAQQEEAMQQMAAEQAMQEQAAAQQQMVQPSPEEAAMPEEAMMQQQVPQEQALQEEPQMQAMGGKLYPNGGYLWDDFWTPVNEYSRQAGVNADKYLIDNTMTREQVEAMEDSPQYKAFTDYILNDATEDERKKYFEWIDGNTGNKNKYIVDGKLVDDWKERFKKNRNDHLYGIQHYTPKYVDAMQETEVPSLATPTYADNATEGTPISTVVGVGTPAMPADDSLSDADKAALDAYAKSPEGKAVIKDIQNKQQRGNGRNVVPRLYDENLRYAGLLGPAVGLGLMAAGVGKPDYSRLDAAVESIGGSPVFADWKPIGNYLTYRPMDIWYEQNRMNANARATDRAISNNAAPLGTKMAGLLANSYNSQIASGDLYRKALEYNDAKRAQVEDFNRGTNQFNAQAYNQNSQFNAEAANRYRQYRAGLAMRAAQQRLDSDAGWYNSLYGNIGGLFKGIGQIGEDNMERNWLARLASTGALGNMTPQSAMNAGLLEYEDEQKKKNWWKRNFGANGGKLKTRKKRGFTY